MLAVSVVHGEPRCRLFSSTLQILMLSDFSLVSREEESKDARYTREVSERGSCKQKDQKFKAILSYLRLRRPDWDA